MWPVGGSNEIFGRNWLLTVFSEALRNMQKALDAAGATLDDVAKFNTYIVGYSWDAVEALLAAAREVFGNPRPLTANTLLGVAALWLPGLLVEIDAVAVI